NPDEVMEVRWINYHALKAEVQTDPDKFTPWLKIYLNEHSDRIFDAKLLKSETH
ncbi:MAG: isopentenyl-diphosphate delta-isomerase, partial [Marinovum sp.]|nr:isopentenyl-diphosphate delta-isomerase [Marinovum sp.]